MLLALPNGLGVAIWQNLLNEHPVAKVIAQSGIIPILSRMIIEGYEHPVSIRNAVEVDGRFELAHTIDAQGNVNRILINMWVSLYAPVAKTYGPNPRDAGARRRIGRVFAEHVFTKAFAPPEERKVTRLEFSGLPSVPPRCWDWRAADELLELPWDATPLDEDFVVDEAPIVFGLIHTDSNQHVNSLVYPRLFQEAALRRIAAHGHDTRLLVSQLEVAFRKPCFAGEQARIMMRSMIRDAQKDAQEDARFGAIGAFVPKNGERPLCSVRLMFSA